MQSYRYSLSLKQANHSFIMVVFQKRVRFKQLRQKTENSTSIFVSSPRQLLDDITHQESGCEWRELADEKQEHSTWGRSTWFFSLFPFSIWSTHLLVELHMWMFTWSMKGSKKGFQTQKKMVEGDKHSKIWSHICLNSNTLYGNGWKNNSTHSFFPKNK